MRALCLLLLLPLAACAGRPLVPDRGLEPGQLLTRHGEPLGHDAFAAATRDARYVLLGESHDSACDHRVQAALIRALADREPVVGLEMVSTERQEVLDRFADGAIELEALDEALAFRARWGVPFALYEPIFAAAQEVGLRLAALNVPAETVRRVSREGLEALPPDVPEPLPPPPAQERMLRRSYEAHGHGGPPSEEGFARFVRVQSLWDTAMAFGARTWSERLDRPVVVLAGAGHVTHGWGIAHRLQQLDPDAGVVGVLPWRGGEAPDPDAADFFFYCPREA